MCDDAIIRVGLFAKAMGCETKIHKEGMKP